MHNMHKICEMHIFLKTVKNHFSRAFQMILNNFEIFHFYLEKMSLKNNKIFTPIDMRNLIIKIVYGTGVRTPKYRSLYKGPQYLCRKFQFMFLSNLEVNQLIYLSSRSLDCEKNDSRAQKMMRKNTIF